MARPLAFRRQVGEDLAGAYGWYEERRIGLGEEFLATVEQSFDAIGEFPEMFVLVHREVRRAMVSRFPYAVFYRVEPKQVVVLAVLHTARDPKLWPRAQKLR